MRGLNLNIIRWGKKIFKLTIWNKYTCSQPVVSLGNTPQSKKMPSNSKAVFSRPGRAIECTHLIVGPYTLGSLAIDHACLRKVIKIIEKLTPDDWTHSVLEYYRDGLSRFGDSWRYADILTVLAAISELIQPSSYLEIGVRVGRSMSVVAAMCPTCDIVGFDLWMPEYAGIRNPGPEFVRSEINKFNFKGNLELIKGASHKTVPQYFERHPDMYFDLITIDGDHSARGAEQDLRTVIPRLKIGGIIVFDDICHPAHPYLMDIWRKIVENNRKFITWKFTELRDGIAFAIKKN